MSRRKSQLFWGLGYSTECRCRNCLRLARPHHHRGHGFRSLQGPVSPDERRRAERLARAAHLLALAPTPRSLPLAGPLTLMLVIGAWCSCSFSGLRWCPDGNFPHAFRTSTGQIPPRSPQLLTSLYFRSNTCLHSATATDPQTTVMRFASTSEALIGFGLLTASVSSVVLLYPALSRMRLLARGVAHLVAAERATGISLLDTHSDLDPRESCAGRHAHADRSDALSGALLLCAHRERCIGGPLDAAAGQARARGSGGDPAESRQVCRRSTRRGPRRPCRNPGGTLCRKKTTRS